MSSSSALTSMVICSRFSTSWPLTPWTIWSLKATFLTKACRSGLRANSGANVYILPVGVQAGPAEKAVEIVEADVLRLRFQVLAAVPLADGLGDVAGLAQDLGDGDLVVQDARFAGKTRPQRAGPHGQASGQQGDSEWACRKAASRSTGAAGLPAPGGRCWASARRSAGRRRRCRGRPSPRCPSGRSGCSASCRSSSPARPAFSCLRPPGRRAGSPAPCSRRSARSRRPADL